MAEPTVSEKLLATRREVFETEVAIAKLEVQLEMEEAKAVAYRAAHENKRLRDRIDELERALGRRQRAQVDDALGIARLRLAEDMRRNRNGDR